MIFATNITWCKLGDAYEFQNLSMKIPVGCEFVQISAYDEKPYDLYLSMVTRNNIEQEAKASKLCKVVEFVSTEDYNFRVLTQNIVDECISTLQMHVRHHRRQLLGKINESYAERSIAVIPVGKEVLFLSGQYRDTRYHVQDPELQNLLKKTSKFNGNDEDFINTGQLNSHLKTFIDLDQAISEAAKTLLEKGMVDYVYNPYVSRGLQNLGFIKANTPGIFTFRI